MCVHCVSRPYRPGRVGVSVVRIIAGRHRVRRYCIEFVSALYLNDVAQMSMRTERRCSGASQDDAQRSNPEATSISLRALHMQTINRPGRRPLRPGQNSAEVSGNGTVIRPAKPAWLHA